MTGIRVNLSHGTLENQQEHLALIREAGIPKILIDLQGPELRIGDLTEPLELPEGAVLRLGRDGVPCPAALIAAVRKAGAKRVRLAAPADTVVSTMQIARCDGETVSYGGLEDD